jgi:NitT/TauT family transport system substrate-binding protein
MNLFLNRQVDAASAMTYNEIAQVLETKNPKTGKLYTMDDLNVLKLENQGTGMLEDGVFARASWLKGDDHEDIAKRFLAASFEGWIYCRDHQDACVDIVLAKGPTLPRGHQTWMMNEINALIWPANKEGIGVMDEKAFERTADIAFNFKVIKKPAAEESFRTDLAKAAVKMVKDDGLDVNGDDWKKQNVTVTAGGK